MVRVRRAWEQLAEVSKHQSQPDDELAKLRKKVAEGIASRISGSPGADQRDQSRRKVLEKARNISKLSERRE